MSIFVTMNEQSQLMMRSLSSTFELQEKAWVGDDFVQALVSRIEELLQKDFPRLIQILYRLDVSEEKVKDELKDQGGSDTAPIIARLIIERQLEKLESKTQYARNDKIPDDEKW